MGESRLMSSPLMQLISISSMASLLVLIYACDDVKRSQEDALKATNESPGGVTRLAPEIDALVPANAQVEKVADGFVFTEGPVWTPDSGGQLIFSDIPGNRVYRWSETDGVQIVLDTVTPDDVPAGPMRGSNGLTLDEEGRLILCEHGNRRVSRLEDNGSRTTLADQFEGKRLNSPNDIVYHSSGAIFFTDPPYGLKGKDKDPAKELPYNGIFRLDQDGSLSLLTRDQALPNGLAFSPDERTLYVSNSDWPQNALLMQYPVLDDLSLGEGSVFFDTSYMIGDKYNGTPDGLKLDTAGNIFTTGPGGVLILDPDGKHLGTIVVPEVVANVGWGDDGRSLFMTATTGLYRIKLSADGLNYRKAQSNSGSDENR